MARPLRRTIWAGSLAVFLAGGAAAAQPRVALLPAALEPDEREERALLLVAESMRARGLAVVSAAEVEEAAQRLGIPREQRDQPESVARLAPELRLEGTVRVQVVGGEGPLSRRGLHALVRGPGGEVRWEGMVPLGGAAVESREADAVASFVLQALGPMAPERRRRERVGEIVLRPGEPVQPSPRMLALARLGAELHLAWRDAPAPAAAPGSPSADNPYPGALVYFDSFPFPRPWGEHVGLGFGYSFAAPRVNLLAPGGVVRETATEHRLTAEAIGRLRPGPDQWLALRTGVAYHAFLVDSASAGSLDHLGLRLSLEYERHFGNLGVLLRGGVRPLNGLGRDQSRVLGGDARSTGWEGRASLSGSLEDLLPNLRWTAGYDVLSYADRFTVGGGSTRFVQTYHRALLGVSWETRP